MKAHSVRHKQNCGLLLVTQAPFVLRILLWLNPRLSNQAKVKVHKDAKPEVLGQQHAKALPFYEDPCESFLRTRLTLTTKNTTFAGIAFNFAGNSEQSTYLLHSNM